VAVAAPAARGVEMAGGMESAEVASGAELGAGSEDLAGSTVASAVEASTSTAAALSEPETLLELVTTETASIAISMAAPLLTEEALLPLLLLLLFWATHLVAPRTTNQNWIFSRQGGIVTLGDNSWTPRASCDGPTAEFGIGILKCPKYAEVVQKTARRYCIFMQYFSQVNTSHFLALDFLRDSSRPNCPT